jgi:hypothetical protein
MILKHRRKQAYNTSHAVTGCFCLLLVALLLWRLAGDGFNPSWLFGAPEFAKGAPALDSFSEPSVGLALVKQEAAQLMLAYTESREEAKASQSGPLDDNAATGAPAGPTSGTSSPAAFNSPAAREASTIKLIAKLHGEVLDLENDLDRKLTTAYYQNASCNEFLDCYLRLLQQTPGSSWVALWLRYALECAGKCGRAEEVADALHHVIQFQQNLPSAEAIRAALENWEAQDPPSPEVSKR